MRSQVSKTALWLVAAALLPTVLACSGGSDDDQAMSTTADASGRIDPAPYRQQIQDVEALLYRRESASWDECDRVGRQLMALGAAVLRSSSAPHLRLGGQQILSFGGEIGGQGDVGYGLPHLPTLRRRWEQVRNEVFLPAAWFQGTAVGMNLAGQSALHPVLDAAQSPAGPRPVARRDLRRCERAIDAFAELCRRGPCECETLGEPTYDISVPSAASDRHVQRWFAWSRDWDQRVRSCWDGLPSRPGFDQDPHYVQAWQCLERASMLLQQVPRGSGMWPVPFRASWEQRFRAAAQQLDQARRELAEVAGD